MPVKQWDNGACHDRGGYACYDKVSAARFGRYFSVLTGSCLSVTAKPLSHSVRAD